MFPMRELSWVAELLFTSGFSQPLVLQEATVMGSWPSLITVGTMGSGTLLSAFCSGGIGPC